MPLTLSTVKVGGKKPDLRLSDSGKLMAGTASTGTPLKRSTAPVA